MRVSHILVKDNPNAALNERAGIKKKAQDLLARALKGDNFEKLAKEFSEDEASAPFGGDIQYIAEGEWLPEIDKEIFKLKKGEIAKMPLQSRMGWHIVKVTDFKPKSLVAFKDMKPRIENFLIQQKMQKEYEKWLEEQKQSAYLEVIFPGDEKYIYDFDRWKKKNFDKVLSPEEFKKKLEAIKIY